MTYRAIYIYPWDLADEGVDSVVREVERLGLDTLTVAGSYHAGKFLRPHGHRSRVLFPEDGTVYFRPDVARHGTLAPILSSLARERDILREATNTQMAVNVWLVLLHNSRLGERHPQSTVSNAFGDRYVYSLCPSAGASGIAFYNYGHLRRHNLAMIADAVAAFGDCAWNSTIE